MCERLCREHTAGKALTRGISIHQTKQSVAMKYRHKGCNGTVRFAKQPKTGFWNITKFKDQKDECVDDIAETSTYCASVYTCRQLTRLVLPHLPEHPKISLKDILRIVKAKEIFKRRTSQRIFSKRAPGNYDTHDKKQGGSDGYRGIICTTFERCRTYCRTENNRRKLYEKNEDKR